MITTQSAHNQLYGHSLLQSETALFSAVTTAKTPHILVPDPEDVFAGPDEALNELLLPLAVIDLQALDPELEGKIPVLYYEDTALDYVCYRLNDDWKITSLVFADDEGGLFETDDEDIEPFEDGYEDVCERLQERFGNRYLQIAPSTIALPETIAYDDAISFFHQVCDIGVAADKQDRKAKKSTIEGGRHYFGPVISLTQFSPYYPVFDNDPEGFRFVGQISTAPFGLVDVTYYLFVHAGSRTVAQLVQMT